MHGGGDWFALDSVLSQLKLLQALAFRPEQVAAGLETFQRAMLRLTPPARRWQPERVFLFSGHMMDAPRRKEPRFPPEMEGAAREAIERALDQQGARAGDLALTQGAAGGDLLFAEACLRRGLRLQLLMPCQEPDFIQHSMLSCLHGEEWLQRYLRVREHEHCLEPRIMPRALGPVPRDVNHQQISPYVRGNLWLLYTSLATALQGTRFICLWNGARGDGPGGTDHMYREVKRRTGQVSWIDTRTLLAALPQAPEAKPHGLPPNTPAEGDTP